MLYRSGSQDLCELSGDEKIEPVHIIIPLNNIHGQLFIIVQEAGEGVLNHGLNYRPDPFQRSLRLKLLRAQEVLNDHFVYGLLQDLRPDELIDYLVQILLLGGGHVFACHLNGSIATHIASNDVSYQMFAQFVAYIQFRSQVSLGAVRG